MSPMGPGQADPVSGDQTKNFGNRERGDREIGAAHAGRSKPYQRTYRDARYDGSRYNRPVVEARLLDENADGVGAKPKKRRVAEADVAELAERDGNPQ